MTPQRSFLKWGMAMAAAVAIGAPATVDAASLSIGSNAANTGESFTVADGNAIPITVNPRQNVTGQALTQITGTLLYDIDNASGSFEALNNVIVSFAGAEGANPDITVTFGSELPAAEAVGLNPAQGEFTRSRTFTIDFSVPFGGSSPQVIGFIEFDTAATIFPANGPEILRPTNVAYNGGAIVNTQGPNQGSLSLSNPICEFTGVGPGVLIGYEGQNPVEVQLNTALQNCTYEVLPFGDIEYFLPGDDPDVDPPVLSIPVGSFLTSPNDAWWQFLPSADGFPINSNTGFASSQNTTGELELFTNDTPYLRRVTFRIGFEGQNNDFFSIDQAANECIYTVDAPASDFDPDGNPNPGSDSEFDINIGATCPWWLEVVYDDGSDWVSVTGFGSAYVDPANFLAPGFEDDNRGPATITYTVDPNGSGATRVARINVYGAPTEPGDGDPSDPSTWPLQLVASHEITQDPCEFTIDDNDFDGNGDPLVGALTAGGDPAGGGPGPNAVELTVNGTTCEWSYEISYAPGDPTGWLTTVPAAPADGTGDQSVEFTATENIGDARTAFITFSFPGQADIVYTVEQAGCEFIAPDPASENFDPTGGSGSFVFEATASICPWEIENDLPSWLTIDSLVVTAPNGGATDLGTLSGTGTVTVNYTVADNTSTSTRSHIILIGPDLSDPSGTFEHEVTQDACGFIGGADPAVSPVLAAAGDSSSFELDAISTVCIWDIIEIIDLDTNAPATWVTSITPGMSGSGSVTIGYDVTPNLGPERQAEIRIQLNEAADETDTVHLVTQADGCEVATVDPTNVVGDPDGETGLSFEITMSSDLCEWELNDGAFPAWITNVSATSGTGTTTVTFDVTSNPGPARDFDIEVTPANNPLGTPALVNVSQGDNCSFTFDPDEDPAGEVFTDAGGSGSITVIRSSDLCDITATTGAPWITGITIIEAGTTVTITYDVAANIGAARADVIEVSILNFGGNTETLDYNVCQAGEELFTVYPVDAVIDATNNFGFFIVETSDPTLEWYIDNIPSWARIDTPYDGNDGVTDYFVGSKIIFYTTEALPTMQSRTETMVMVPLGGIGGMGCPLPNDFDDTFTLTQAADCLYTVDPGKQTLSASAGPGSFTVVTNGLEEDGDDACTWRLELNDIPSWITIDAPHNDPLYTAEGTETVTFTLDDNTGNPARTAHIQIATENGLLIHTITQSDDCVVAFDPGSANPSSAPASGTVDIVGGTDCAWSLTTSVAPWLTIDSPTTGTGPATIEWSVSANQGPARTARIELRDESGSVVDTFTVFQDGGCEVVLSPTNVSVPAEGSIDSVVVTADAGCEWPVTVVTGGDWITITDAGTGIGTSQVVFEVNANAGPSRIGTIQIGNRLVRVNQANGCELLPIDPSANFVSAGGSGSFELAAAIGSLDEQAACSFTVTSSASWVVLDPANPTNFQPDGLPVDIDYEVAANNGPARSATITVTGANGQTLTHVVTQDEGCTVVSTTVSRDSFDHRSASGQILVTTSTTACSWYAVSSASWLVVKDTGTGTGNGQINFTVDSYLEDFDNERSATITIFLNQADAGYVPVEIEITQDNLNQPAISGAPVDFNHLGGNGLASISAAAGTLSGQPWSVSTTAPWISLGAVTSGTGNAQVSYSVPVWFTNPMIPNDRSGEIIVTLANGETASITVTQEDLSTVSAALTSNTPNPFNHLSGVGSIAVTATTGAPWTAEVVDGSDWLQIVAGDTGTGNGQLSFTVASYLFERDTRTGTVRITLANGETADVVVTQTNDVALGLTTVPASSPLRLDLNHLGGSRIVRVTSATGMPWTIESNESWIEVIEGESGVANGSVTINVEKWFSQAGPGGFRQGTLTVTLENGETDTVLVHQQDDTEVNLTTPGGQAIEFSHMAGSATFRVLTQSGVNWTATVEDEATSWLQIIDGSQGSVDSASGSGEAQVMIQVANFFPREDTDPRERTATITVTIPNGDTAEIEITQRDEAELELETIPDSTFINGDMTVVFDEEGGDGIVLVKTLPGMPWTAESDSSWLQIITGESGVGNGQITFMVPEWFDQDEREAIITVTLANGVQASVNVLQIDGSTVVLGTNPSPADYDHRGGVGVISVATGPVTPWVLDVDVDWLQIVEGNTGVGSAQIFYSVPEWVDVLGDRTATVTITLENGLSETVVINQTNGALVSLTGNPADLTYTHVGGTGTVSIDTQAGMPWTAESTASWLQITSSAAGTGSGQLSISIPEWFANSTRSAEIVVTLANGESASITVTQIDNVAVSLVATPNVFTHLGGNGTIGVTTASGMPWTAESNVDWLQIASGDAGTGSAQLAFTVDEYFGGASREAVVTVTLESGVTGSVTITQTDNVTVSLASIPSPASFNHLGGSGILAVNTAGGMPWTAESTASWLLINSGDTGTGPAQLAYSVPSYFGGDTRTAEIIVTLENGASATLLVTQTDATTVVLSTNPNPAEFNEAGGTGTVTVTATSGMPWNAVASNSWIAIVEGEQGVGAGTITFSIPPHQSTTPRSGTITVTLENGRSQTVTITQNDTCQLTINPVTRNFNQDGGTGFTVVNVGPTCDWIATVSEGASWVSLVSGDNGRGNGQINYQVAPYTDGDSREATITITLDNGLTAVHTITQTDECTMTATLLEGSPFFTEIGGVGAITVETEDNCPWTATTDVPWLTIEDGSTGVGTAQIFFRVAASEDAELRVGNIIINLNNETVTIPIPIEQGNNCSTAFLETSPSAISVPHTGGSQTVNVVLQPSTSLDYVLKCRWVASVSDPWITILEGGSDEGNGVVTIAVAPNTGSGPNAARIGYVKLSLDNGAEVYISVIQSEGYNLLTSFGLAPDSEFPFEKENIVLGFEDAELFVPVGNVVPIIPEDPEAEGNGDDDEMEFTRSDSTGSSQSGVRFALRFDGNRSMVLGIATFVEGGTEVDAPVQGRARYSRRSTRSYVTAIDGTLGLPMVQGFESNQYDHRLNLNAQVRTVNGPYQVRIAGRDQYIVGPSQAIEASGHSYSVGFESNVAFRTPNQGAIRTARVIDGLDVKTRALAIPRGSLAPANPGNIYVWNAPMVLLNVDKGVEEIGGQATLRFRPERRTGSQTPNPPVRDREVPGVYAFQGRLQNLSVRSNGRSVITLEELSRSGFVPDSLLSGENIFPERTVVSSLGTRIITDTLISESVIELLRQGRPSVSPEVLTFSSFAPAGEESTFFAGSFDVTFSEGVGNRDWTVRTSAPEWVTLHTTSGSGDGTVSYTISGNAGSTESRTATVEVVIPIPLANTGPGGAMFGERVVRHTIIQLPGGTASVDLDD